MTEGKRTHILRQMAGLQAGGVRENPLTTSRAMRLLLAKVAQDHAGLALEVSSISNTTNDLDPALADLADGLMLVRLDRNDQPVGLIALDKEMRAAVLEIATIGALQHEPAEARAPTGTDHFMCVPFLDAFLAAFPEAVHGTELEGWVAGAQVGTMFANTRRAALVLEEWTYRTIQMTVQLGQTDRQGVLVLMLPIPKSVVEEAPPVPEKPDWSLALASRVEGASAVLDARLHRFTLPLSAVRALAVDTVLPLHGCTVSAVLLKSLDGRTIAEARLGQSGGKRAVRIQSPPEIDMRDLPACEVPEPRMVALSEVAQAVDLPFGAEARSESVSAAKAEAGAAASSDESLGSEADGPDRP